MSPNLVGLIHLFIVYIVWGSTYLAIRIAVTPHAGFPPLSLGASRVWIAGLFLLMLALARRKSIRPGRQDLIILAASGFLLWPVANGLVLWAEQRADSSLAALLVSISPIWMVVIETVAERKTPSPMLVASLLVGFVGLGVLSAPSLATGVEADILATVGLLLAGLFWSLGSYLQYRWPVSLSPLANSGYQHIFGGLGFLAALAILPEPQPNPTAQAWGAWAYLIVFGSILAFTSFTQTLRLLPSSVAMTYAYVNPVIALFLGRLVLQEPLTVSKLAGSALILLGVAGVFRERYGRFRLSSLTRVFQNGKPGSPA